MKTPSCFKAYDIRGKIGESLNEEIVYKIGQAFGQFIKARTVVVGGDIRQTSEAFKTALSQGLLDMGIDVIDLGMTGTEEIYFAAQFLDVDGGIEITASHNPIDFNGMKLVSRGARPISGDSGLKTIQALVENENFKPTIKKNQGKLTKLNIVPDYVNHLLTYIKLEQIKPVKIVCNAGNGAAGHVIDKLEQIFKNTNIPIQFIKIHHQPDGSFPNGIPNPILIENRQVTCDAVITHHADFGVAWDGDFDRCFFFDENGKFIEGYYIVGLLAETFLRNFPNEKIIHDPRLIWNTQDIANNFQGIAVQSKTGHAFIKERMRQENAIYGGEMSAHHYFRDFGYCDSGMIPWLMVSQLISETGCSLSELVEKRIQKFPSSGEINFTLKNTKQALETINNRYKDQALSIDHTDGLSYEFTDWRFNIRCSNTEPVVRLNVESKQDIPLMQKKVDEIKDLLLQFQS